MFRTLRSNHLELSMIYDHLLNDKHACGLANVMSARRAFCSNVSWVDGCVLYIGTLICNW